MKCHRKKDWQVYYHNGCKHHDPQVTGLQTNAIALDRLSVEDRLDEIERRLDANGINV